LIAEYASTGDDASLIIHCIHATNSARHNHKNKERMQNFYDGFGALRKAEFAYEDLLCMSRRRIHLSLRQPHVSVARTAQHYPIGATGTWYWDFIRSLTR
jgi:hypothetical protein